MFVTRKGILDTTIECAVFTVLYTNDGSCIQTKMSAESDILD